MSSYGVTGAAGAPDAGVTSKSSESVANASVQPGESTGHGSATVGVERTTGDVGGTGAEPLATPADGTTGAGVAASHDRAEPAVTERDTGPAHGATASDAVATAAMATAGAGAGRVVFGSPFTTFILLVWLAGGLALATPLALGLLRAARARRSAEPVREDEWLAALERARRVAGVRRRVSLRWSAGARTAMAGGAFRPFILLPPSAAAWNAEQRDLILAHELVHVRRHDPLRQLLGRCALCLYWFHPLAWVAVRIAELAREEACDEAVLALGHRASLYARHLMELADPDPLPLPALSPLNRTQLEKRIMSILRFDAKRSPSFRRALAAAAVGGVWALGIAAATPVARVADSRESTPEASSALVDAAFQETPPLAVDTPLVADSLPAVDTEPTAPVEIPEPPAPPPAPAPPQDAPPESPAPPAPSSPWAPPTEPPIAIFGYGARSDTSAFPGVASVRGSVTTLVGYGGPRTDPAAACEPLDDLSGFATRVKTVRARQTPDSAGAIAVHLSSRSDHRTVGESELCFESDDPVEFVDTSPFIASMGEGAWVVLAAIGDGVVQRLEITPADGGLAHAWTVDGEPRSFDDEAVAWRDAMFDVFQPGTHTGSPFASARVRSPLDPWAAISSWDVGQSELAARARTTVGRIAALESAMVATEDEETRARLGEEVEALRQVWEEQQRELQAEREQRVEMLREQMEQQIESMRQQAEEYRLRSEERRFQLEEYLLQRDSATAISGLGPGLRAYRDDVDSLAAEIAWLRLLAQPRPITSAHDAERAADAEARLRELIPSIR